MPGFGGSAPAFWRQTGRFPLHLPIAILFSLLILAVGGTIPPRTTAGRDERIYPYHGHRGCFRGAHCCCPPYKTRHSLPEDLAVMATMRDEGKLDADLFTLFLRSGVWREDATQHLLDPAYQVDIGL